MCRQIWANFPALLICPTSPLFADSRDGEWARVPIFAQFACRAPTLSFMVFTRSTLIHLISPDAQTAAGRSAIQITTPPSPVFRTPRATQLPRWSNALLPTTDYLRPFFTQLVQLFSSDTSQKATRVRTAASRVRLTSATATARREPTAGLVSPCPLIRSLAHPFILDLEGRRYAHAWTAFCPQRGLQAWCCRDRDRPHASKLV